jgi:2-polyprenyl-6-methoxyphenol hydroxylase-like FAD-dependent oxidoreductase
LTGDSHSFLRANRRRIRIWLTSDLPIQWGKRYDSHTIDDNSSDRPITVSFEDGTTATGDILVGADGVGSRVRASLDPTPLPPLPIGLIVGETIVDGELCAHLRALGNSFYSVSVDSFRLLVGLRDTAPDLSWGEYYWLFFWREPLVAEQGVEHPIMNASQEERLQYVKDRLRDAGVDPKMWEIVKKQKAEGIYPSFVLRDRVPTMCPDGPVTLLGDAAHAMTPCKYKSHCSRLDTSSLVNTHIPSINSTRARCK